ncbi:RluA family pseudouridine synthase [Treponema sp.]|uniref:RluA family pseudouridine synthase n=1 Tax=Treponema sp. TaxID=166 RepID=UPI003F039FD3
MEFKEFEAKEDDSGRRLDKNVRRIFEAKKIRPDNLFKLIRKGLVKLNGANSFPEARIHPGDKILIAGFLLENSTAIKQKNTPVLPQNFSAQTIFRNSSLWIINKPEGIEVQPSRAEKFCLADFVAQNTQTDSLSFRPGPLHRIDKFTTGLVAFSQSLEGARWFSQHIQSHSIKKTYLAVLENSLPKESLTIDDTIESRAACTKVSCIARGKYGAKDISLAKIQIETGRKHQIRIHCSKKGFPLLGDTQHNGSAFSAGEFSGCRFFLHAWKLEFPVPNPLGLPETMQAPIPPKFKKFIENFLKIPDADL